MLVLLGVIIDGGLIDWLRENIAKDRKHSPWEPYFFGFLSPSLNPIHPPLRVRGVVRYVPSDAGIVRPDHVGEEERLKLGKIYY